MRQRCCVKVGCRRFQIGRRISPGSVTRLCRVGEDTALTRWFSSADAGKNPRRVPLDRIACRGVSGVESIKNLVLWAIDTDFSLSLGSSWVGPPLAARAGVAIVALPVIWYRHIKNGRFWVGICRRGKVFGRVAPLVGPLGGVGAMAHTPESQIRQGLIERRLLRQSLVFMGDKDADVYRSLTAIAEGLKDGKVRASCPVGAFPKTGFQVAPRCAHRAIGEGLENVRIAMGCCTAVAVTPPLVGLQVVDGSRGNDADPERVVAAPRSAGDRCLRGRSPNRERETDRWRWRSSNSPRTSRGPAGRLSGWSSDWRCRLARRE